jgi:hypothetical protein
MTTQSTVVFDGKRYSVDNVKFEFNNENVKNQSISLIADAMQSGGGYFMLDCMDLDIEKVVLLENLHRERIHWIECERQNDDTLGSCCDDLDTSGWTFPEYSQDRDDFLEYGWNFVDMLITFENAGKNLFYITVQCKLTNMADPEKQVEASCGLYVGENRRGLDTFPA